MEDRNLEVTGSVQNMQESPLISEEALEEAYKMDTGQPTEEPPIERVRFKDLTNAERAYRELQSKHDKMYAELQKALQERDSVYEKAKLFEQILTDDELKEAFVYQVKPEIAPTKETIKKRIQEQLEKEFGYNYKERMSDPLDGLEIQKRVRELYDEYDQKFKKSTIEEIIKKRQEEEAKFYEQLQKTIEDIKSTYGVEDNVIEEYAKWKQKVVYNDKELFKIFRHNLKFLQQQKTPQAANVKGMTPAIGLRGGRGDYLKSW